MAPPATKSICHDQDGARSDLLTDSFQALLSFIAHFRSWLDEKTATGHDFGGVASSVRASLDRYGEEIRQAYHESTALPDRQPGLGQITISSDGLDILVRGPRPADTFKLRAKSPEQAEQIIGVIMEAVSLGVILHHEQDRSPHIVQLQALSDAEDTVRSASSDLALLRATSSRLSQPAKVTVQAHIKLLKEYNDMKDVGQQLIGLIAENRGVPIGTLYQDSQYGVTADD